MKDEHGVYYYPSMQDRNVRMYVRENEDEVIEYRLFNVLYPEVWERHEWITLDVVRTAARMYHNEKRNPLALYDEAVARRLLAEQ